MDLNELFSPKPLFSLYYEVYVELFWRHKIHLQLEGNKMLHATMTEDAFLSDVYIEKVLFPEALVIIMEKVAGCSFQEADSCLAETLSKSNIKSLDRAMQMRKQVKQHYKQPWQWTMSSSNGMTSRFCVKRKLVMSPRS